jgi:hypothetical protein
MNWFSRHFTEQGEAENRSQKELRKEQEKQASQAILVSKLPQYADEGFDGWQATHKGYRMQRLSSMLKRNLIGLIMGVLIVSTALLGFLAYYSSTFYYDAKLAMIVRVPDPLFTLLAEATGLFTVFFIVSWAIIVGFYGKALDKFHNNSKVYKISAKNFLNERWYIELFNGLRPEPEPIGKAVLANQKIDIDKRLAELNADLKKLTASADATKQADGGNLTTGQIEADKIQLQAEIAKYQSVKSRIDACLEDQMTICSVESRDHNYVWSHRVVQVEENGVLREKVHGVLEKEIGWKIYLAVPGVNLEACTGTDELPVNIGFKQKLLDTYQFAACIDLPPHPEIIKDPESDSAVIVDVPLLGVRDTPHGGAYYDWKDADGILVSRLLDAPLSASMTAEDKRKDSIIAKQQDQIADLSLENAVVGLPEVLKRLGLAVKPSELVPITQPTNQVEQPKPEAKPTNGSRLKTALMATGIIASLSIIGLAVGIATHLIPLFVGAM